MLPGDTDIGERIQAERLKRQKSVQIRRLKRLAALEKRKSRVNVSAGESNNSPTQVSDGELLENLLGPASSNFINCNSVFSI